MNLNRIPLLMLLLTFHVWAHANSNATVSASCTENGEYVAAESRIYFTENVGQWDSKVLFKCSISGATIWITTDGTYYQFIRRMDTEHELPLSGFRKSATSVSSQFETMSVKTTFVDANPKPTGIGEKIIRGKNNYFIGNDPAYWYTDVPNYRAVCVKDIYPGIDLRYYANGCKVEYGFFASSGTLPSMMRNETHETSTIRAKEQADPGINNYQTIVIKQQIMRNQINISECKRIAEQVGLSYSEVSGFEMCIDSSQYKTLVNDPMLSFGTYLGGTAGDEGNGIGMDFEGNMYITGSTVSLDFPIGGGDSEPQGYADAFVSKISADGTELIFSTFVGGSNEDNAHSIAVADNGETYITGVTGSSDFPCPNGYMSVSKGLSDAFVAKLNSTGNELIYGTYLGGSESENGQDIAIGEDDTVYVIGSTSSADFPTTENAYQPTFQGGFDDAFVAGFNSNGSSLIFSTYFGGSSVDWGGGIAISQLGDIFFTGVTFSNDFPISTGAFDATLGGFQDAYATRLSSGGDSLVYSTFIGGNGYDYGTDVSVDEMGLAYIVGSTYSIDFPTKNEYLPAQGGSDAFVLKLNEFGSNLLYSTYLGGTEDDVANGVDIDDLGYCYVTGATLSMDFPTHRAFQLDQDDRDGYLVRVDQSGNDLNYSTYIGGNGSDYPNGIVVDNAGEAHITGSTTSSDLGVKGGFQNENAGAYDVFVCSVAMCDCASHCDIDLNGYIGSVDVVLMVNFVYKDLDDRLSLSTFCPRPNGDWNCDNTVNPVDVVWYVNYVYKSIGDGPCNPCD